MWLQKDFKKRPTLCDARYISYSLYSTYLLVSLWITYKHQRVGWEKITASANYICYEKCCDRDVGCLLTVIRMTDNNPILQWCWKGKGKNSLPNVMQFVSRIINYWTKYLQLQIPPLPSLLLSPLHQNASNTAPTLFVLFGLDNTFQIFLIGPHYLLLLNA